MYLLFLFFHFDINSFMIWFTDTVTIQLAILDSRCFIKSSAISSATFVADEITERCFVNPSRQLHVQS